MIDDQRQLHTLEAFCKRLHQLPSAVSWMPKEGSLIICGRVWPTTYVTYLPAFSDYCSLSLYY